MSEIEQANGIEIPAEVVERVAKDRIASEQDRDHWVPWERMGERERQEVCDEVRSEGRHLLDAWGVTTEARGAMTASEVADEPFHRYVTPWLPRGGRSPDAL